MKAGAQSKYLDSHCVGHKRVELDTRIVLDHKQFVEWFCLCIFAMFLYEYSLLMKDIFDRVAMMDTKDSFLLDQTYYTTRVDLA